MAAISLDTQLHEYWPLLARDEKLSVLAQIRSFLTAKEKPARMTKEEFIIQYNKDIDEAEAEIKAGLIISQADIEKESETW